MAGEYVAEIQACPRCGLVQRLPDPWVAERASCARCDALVWDPRGRAARTSWTGAFALSALVLYPVGISLPIMQLERFGHSVDASVWSGSIGMLREGEIWIGSVVLLCSVILPLLKLAALCALVWRRPNLARSARARTYRLVEWAGRWGMLDVLLVAVVVAWVKIGDLVEVRPGPAALAFTACVVSSLCASAAFDPHVLWEEDPVHVG